MRVLVAEIAIDVPAQEVWDLFTDFEGHQFWNPFFTRIRRDGRDPQRLHISSKVGSFSPFIIEKDPPHRLMWMGKIMGVDWLFVGNHLFEIIPQSSTSCIFRQKEEFSGILVDLFWPFIDQKIRSYFDQMNQALKKICEPDEEAKLLKVDTYG